MTLSQFLWDVLFLQRQSPKKAGKEKLHFGLFLGLFLCSIITYMIDEMAIYLKALEIQGLFRILGKKISFIFMAVKYRHQRLERATYCQKCEQITGNPIH